MGGGHHIRGAPGEFVPPHLNQTNRRLAAAVGCTFWLWLFWRAKHDGKALMGIEHPWDHGHHGGDHGKGHGDSHGRTV